MAWLATMRVTVIMAAAATMRVTVIMAAASVGMRVGLRLVGRPTMRAVTGRAVSMDMAMGGGRRCTRARGNVFGSDPRLLARREFGLEGRGEHGAEVGHERRVWAVDGRDLIFSQLAVHPC